MSWTLNMVATAFRAEIKQLWRSPALVVLTLVQSVTFMFLVSLFGMTGANAPTAVIDHDTNGRAQAFIDDLKLAHHSFSISREADEQAAMKALKRGKLVAIISIPKDFSKSVVQGLQSTINVVVDNIDTDMTDDIQRALPSAIVAFGRRQNLPYICSTVVENDLIDHDTGFVEYLVASSLILAAFITSCNLSATAVAREYESKIAAIISLSPTHPIVPIFGRVVAASIFSLATLIVPLAIAIFAYGIIPKHPWETAFALVVSVFAFSCIGAALGALMKHTLPVASVVFGLALPLFMISGSYEPERFDGNFIWSIAHFSPIYYGVGIIEHAVHGLKVTPEPVTFNFVALFLWGLGFLGLIALFGRKGVAAS